MKNHVRFLAAFCPFYVRFVAKIHDIFVVWNTEHKVADHSAAFSFCPLIPNSQHAWACLRGIASLVLRTSLAVTGAVMSGTRAHAGRVIRP